jgi:hypothetical protein
MNGFQLDAGARLALDVALGTASAMGDERCGTEYLLFGIVATAEKDVAELMELFALDTLRVERAISMIRGDERGPEREAGEDLPLSPRAQIALDVRPVSGNERRSAFDLIVAMLHDPRSGAATVLRRLGVRVGEVRRLAELGAARLDRAEVEDLITALDRRTERHLGWWGPTVEGPVERVPLPDNRPLVLARSETAVASLEGVVAGPDGFGFTVNVVSCADWILPPTWEPSECLVPGVGPLHRSDPDVVTIDLRYSDGGLVSNRLPEPRYRSDPPTRGTLVMLGTRTIVDDRNDRRVAARRSETSEWWAWPLPPSGEVTLMFEWRSEALHGSATLEAGEIVARATVLRDRN